MQAELSRRPCFSDPDWIFEVKWDGYRAVAELNLEKSRLYSRNGVSFAKAFPNVYNEICSIGHQAIIDGEIVVLDFDGRPSFQMLQNYRARQKVPIQYQVFDCLSFDGKDLTSLPLIERKAYLKKLLPACNIIRYCDHIEGEGELFFEQIVKMDLEGMIAKRADSKYLFGRSKNWLKIKNHKYDDFLIVGFLQSESRSYFKGLVLADVEDGRLCYRGHVGGGFSDQVLKQIHRLLVANVIEDKPIESHEAFDAPVTWVKPRYSCNVRFTKITADGILRHPVFEGLKMNN